MCVSKRDILIADKNITGCVCTEGNHNDCCTVTIRHIDKNQLR